MAKPGLQPWVPGQSGNPKGRPKGARSKLAETFLAAYAADFEAHGPEVIAKVRADDPATYLRVAASILPKELNVAVERSARELNDDDLADIALGRGSGAAGEAAGAQEHNPVH